jgi:hypothetical protein
MAQQRLADDFAAIRARLEELRLERERAARRVRVENEDKEAENWHRLLLS